MRFVIDWYPLLHYADSVSSPPFGFLKWKDKIEDVTTLITELFYGFSDFD